MLDFTPVRERRTTMHEFARHLTIPQLRSLTEESVAAMLQLLDGCTDAEVVFVPNDPDAKVTYAVNPADTDLAWTLGHVVVHACASAEEYAFVGSELARGVEYHGRSRVEVPWPGVTTVDQCRRKLRGRCRRQRLGRDRDQGRSRQQSAGEQCCKIRVAHGHPPSLCNLIVSILSHLLISLARNRRRSSAAPSRVR